MATGGRLNPHFSSSMRAAIDSPAARRVDRQPRGLVQHHRFGVDEEDAIGEDHERP